MHFRHFLFNTLKRFNPWIVFSQHVRVILTKCVWRFHAMKMQRPQLRRTYLELEISLCFLKANKSLHSIPIACNTPKTCSSSFVANSMSLRSVLTAWQTPKVRLLHSKYILVADEVYLWCLGCRRDMDEKKRLQTLNPIPPFPPLLRESRKAVCYFAVSIRYVFIWVYNSFG